MNESDRAGSRPAPGVSVALAFVLSVLAFSPAEATERELRTAERLYAAKSYQAASRVLEDLVQRHPMLGPAHRLLGHTYFELGKYKLARRSLSHSIANGLMSRDVLVRLVFIERRAHRLATALNLLRLAQQVDPENEDILVNLAATASEIGLTREARAVCEQVVDSHPLNTSALVLLGNLRLKAESKNAAASAFEVAYGLGRRSPDLARTIADLRFQTGDLEVAAMWYERALLAAAPPPELRVRHARVLFALRDFVRAEEAAKKIVSSTNLHDAAIQRAVAKAYLLLGEIEAAREAMDAARGHWEKALEHGEDSPDVHSYLAAYYFRAKNYPVAFEHYRDRLVRDPHDADTLYFQTRCLLEMDRTEGARSSLQTYLEHHGLDDRARGLIAAMVERE